jgi:hypothetical protein
MMSSADTIAGDRDRDWERAGSEPSAVSRGAIGDRECFSSVQESSGESWLTSWVSLRLGRPIKMPGLNGKNGARAAILGKRRALLGEYNSHYLQGTAQAYEPEVPGIWRMSVNGGN